MENWAKGTVTPLTSAFPVEEAQKAAQRVQETLGTSRKELNKLEEFAQDNRELMKLVQKLPDEMSHNIMVPIGKAAFFPGRIIHTNEFVVLLGEGYYAERTAKQTLDVLRRRAKVLQSKVEGIKAVMEDLHAESLFFTNTAAEANAGVMEIREDYVENYFVKEKPDSGHSSSSAKLDSSAPATATAVDDDPSAEDKEFDLIMSRLSELEQEEAEDNGFSSEEREEPSVNDSEHEESEDEKVGSQTQICMGSSMRKQVTLTNNEPSTSEASFEAPREKATIRSPADILKFEEGKANLIKTDCISQKKISFQKDLVEPTSVKVPKAEKEIVNPLSYRENYERPFPSKTQALKVPIYEDENERQSDSRKAFTGLIIEHGTSAVSDTAKGLKASQAPESKNPRPVSRFKMQKANR